jgi:hypothetical protein
MTRSVNGTITTNTFACLYSANGLELCIDDHELLTSLAFLFSGCETHGLGIWRTGVDSKSWAFCVSVFRI